MQRVSSTRSFLLPWNIRALIALTVRPIRRAVSCEVSSRSSLNWIAVRTPRVNSLIALASFCIESQNNRIKTGVRAFFQLDFLYFFHFSLDKYMCVMAHIAHDTY